MANNIYMFALLTIMLVIILYLIWRITELKRTFRSTCKQCDALECLEEPTALTGEDAFFISSEARVIFILLYVENEERARLLGITEEMYESIELAKSWKSKIVKQIHPDRCKHPKAEEAMAVINSIYARMKRYAQ